MSSSIVNDLNNYATEVHLEELRRTQGENQERQERERSQSQAEPSDTPGEPTTVRIEEELVLPTPPSVHAVVVGALCHSVYATSVLGNSKHQSFIQSVRKVLQNRDIFGLD